MAKGVHVVEANIVTVLEETTEVWKRLELRSQEIQYLSCHRASCRDFHISAIQLSDSSVDVNGMYSSPTYPSYFSLSRVEKIV
jgi:hypothetical protein